MSVTFKRNAGKILWHGDSITRGRVADTGGWRKSVQAALESARIDYTSVGPTTSYSPGMTQTAHAGTAGATLSSSTIATAVSTYTPNVICIAYGMNDMGGGTTAAAFLTTLDAAIDACQSAGILDARILIQKTYLPDSGDYVGYYANLAQYQAYQSQIAARAAAQGVTLVDVGDPVKSDGIHPIDGATGYESMATAMLSALLQVIP